MDKVELRRISWEPASHKVELRSVGLRGQSSEDVSGESARLPLLFAAFLS